MAQVPLVDAEVIVDARDSEWIADTAFDVLPQKPFDELSPLGRNDEILTPHTDFHSEESMVDQRGATGYLGAFGGKEPHFPINLKVLQTRKP